MMLPRMHVSPMPMIDEVGVGLAHRDRAHRRAVDLAVGDRRPVVAAVGGLPEPAADGAEVGLARAALHAAGGDRAAAAVGADVAPAVSGHQGRIEERRWCHREGASAECRREGAKPPWRSLWLAGQESDHGWQRQDEKRTG